MISLFAMDVGAVIMTVGDPQLKRDLSLILMQGESLIRRATSKGGSRESDLLTKSLSVGLR